MRFIWDPAKADDNHQKHGVTFEQAAEACQDPDHLEWYDVDHSDDEDRWIVVGLAGGAGLVIRVTTSDLDAEEVRIISARLASPALLARYIAHLGSS